jgi:RNA polymerase sporulation-specific sigma factor
MSNYNYNSMDDEALQQLAVSGDLEAQDVLARRYYKLVRMAARPYFLVGGDGEDIIQEGMLGLLNAIMRYSPDRGTSFKTYAEFCVRRTLYTAVRGALRQKHSPLNDSVSFESPQFDESKTQQATVGRAPEEQLIAQERVEEIRQAFSSCLSEFESRILELYLEGLSYNEMAEKTNKSAKSIDNAVQRIKKKLVRCLNSGDISVS